MSDSMFPALIKNIDTGVVTLVHSVDEMPDGNLQIIKTGLRSYMCFCRFSKQFKIVTEMECCELCKKNNLIPITPETVKEVLKTIYKN